MIEKDEIVTLDNGIEYVVVSKLINDDGKTYYYLIEKDGNEVFILYENNDKLVEVVDKELFTNLLKKMIDQEVKTLTPEEKEIITNNLKELSDMS